MTRFIGIVFIIIASFYVLGYIGRLLFPYIMTRIAKRMMNNFPGGQDMYNKSKEKEGEVNIKYTEKGTKNPNKDKGEYVDYEEIE